MAVVGLRPCVSGNGAYRAYRAYRIPRKHIYSGWWFGTMEFHVFHSVGNFIIPTDFNSIIFQRGRSTTKQYFHWENHDGPWWFFVCFASVFRPVSSSFEAPPVTSQFNIWSILRLRYDVICFKIFKSGWV